MAIRHRKFKEIAELIEFMQGLDRADIIDITEVKTAEIFNQLCYSEFTLFYYG